MASATASAPTPAGANSVESLLSHVQTIEGDRARLLKELEDARAKIGRLSESKQAEMKQALDNMIMKMIKDSVQDPKVLEEFETGTRPPLSPACAWAGRWCLGMPIA